MTFPFDSKFIFEHACKGHVWRVQLCNYNGSGKVSVWPWYEADGGLRPCKASLIPEPILEAFTRKMTMRWLKQLVSGKYRVGAVKTRVIGRRSNDYRHALELYQRNLKILAVSYLLKGASREAAFALNLPRWHEGGNVTGKRWGRSQNLLQDSLLSGS